MCFHVRSELHSELQEPVQHCVGVSAHNIQVHHESWSAQVTGAQVPGARVTGEHFPGELFTAGHLKAAQMRIRWFVFI